MKIVFLFLGSLVAAAPLAWWNLAAGTGVLSALYNVIGIVFAIGMGLVVTFSINGVENKEYIVTIRNNIKQVRQKFITLFFICTMLFICRDYIHACKIVLFDIINISYFLSDFILLFFFLSIIYFIHNFIRIQKLHCDIFDRLLQEKNQRNQPMPKS